MPSAVTLDSCILIEFFRAKDKSKTMFAKLVRDNTPQFISTVVLFEVLSGLNASNQESCMELLRKVVCLPFDERTAEIAADLSRTLRKNRLSAYSGKRKMKLRKPFAENRFIWGECPSG